MLSLCVLLFIRMGGDFEQQVRVRTRHAEVEVVCVGDKAKQVVFTVPDIGLNCKQQRGTMLDITDPSHRFELL